jgi:hypothetical protein
MGLLFQQVLIVHYSQQGFRIKTDADATNSSVSGVTYSGNTATGCTDYGVIVDQVRPFVWTSTLLTNLF